MLLASGVCIYESRSRRTLDASARECDVFNERRNGGDSVCCDGSTRLKLVTVVGSVRFRIRMMVSDGLYETEAAYFAELTKYWKT